MPAPTSPYPSNPSPTPRRSKAEALHLVHVLKRAIVVSAIVGFGVFGGLVAHRLPALGATAASAASSTTSSAPSNSENGDDGGFFGQGSSGSGVSGSSASSSSSSSSSPITTSGVS